MRFRARLEGDAEWGVTLCHGGLSEGTLQLKQAVYSVVANTGVICLGMGAVLIIPAFAADAYFWLPAAIAAQIWMCCIRRVGR